MLSILMNLLSACLWPSSGNSYSDSKGKQEGLLWYKDSAHHLLGDFSMAVVQANNLLEDQSQLESGPLTTLPSGPCGTFVGVYDGHGGPETSRFVNDHLFHHLKSKFLTTYLTILLLHTESSPSYRIRSGAGFHVSGCNKESL